MYIIYNLLEKPQKVVEKKLWWWPGTQLVKEFHASGTGFSEKGSESKCMSLTTAAHGRGGLIHKVRLLTHFRMTRLLFLAVLLPQLPGEILTFLNSGSRCLAEFEKPSWCMLTVKHSGWKRRHKDGLLCGSAKWWSIPPESCNCQFLLILLYSFFKGSIFFWSNVVAMHFCKSCFFIISISIIISSIVKNSRKVNTLLELTS